MNDSSFIERYWNDPDFRKRSNTELALDRARYSHMIDCNLIRKGLRWPANWSQREKDNSSRRLLSFQRRRIERIAH